MRCCPLLWLENRCFEKKKNRQTGFNAWEVSTLCQSPKHKQAGKALWSGSLKFKDFKGQWTHNGLTKALFGMPGSELLSEEPEWNALLWYKVGSIGWQRLIKVKQFTGNSEILGKLNFLIEQVLWSFFSQSWKEGSDASLHSSCLLNSPLCPLLLLASRCRADCESAKHTSFQKESF